MDHTPEQVVVAGMLAGGVPVIDELAGMLSDRHFVDPVARSLFSALCKYRGVASGVLTSAALVDVARDDRMDAGMEALLAETYEALAASPVGLADARWAASRVRSDRERADTATALSEAAEIASGEVTDQDGARWAGPTQAREWAASRFGEIEADYAGTASSGADVRTEATDILNAYAEAHLARASGASDGRPRFGIKSLDDVCEGINKGELFLIAAAQSVGKTHAVISLMYNAVVSQGMHVFFATSETLRQTVRARLIARHSRCEHLVEARDAAGAPNGLDSAAIERGSLPSEQVHLFHAVVQDLCADPEGRGYGRAHISQVAHGATVRSIAAQVSAAARAQPVDLLVIDYLALLAPERRRGDLRTDLAQVIIDAKRLATTFRDGTGIPVVSPWQLSRAAQEEMERTGTLELRGLAETSEAEKSADTVLCITADGAKEQNRFQGWRAHISKNRDGQTRTGDDAIPLRVDYATGYITDRVSAGSPSSNGSGDLSNLDSLVNDYV